MLSPSSWHVLSPSVQVCDQECVLSVLSGGGGAVPESMPVPGMWPVGTGRGGLGDSPRLGPVWCRTVVSVSRSASCGPPLGGPLRSPLSLHSHRGPGGRWEHETEVCRTGGGLAPRAPASHLTDTGSAWGGVPTCQEDLQGKQRGSWPWAVPAWQPRAQNQGCSVEFPASGSPSWLSTVF